LHSLYFPANSLLKHTAPQVLGLDTLTRELVLFLCEGPRPALRDARHAQALALLETLLPLARAEAFSLPRPASSRARKLADHFTAVPEDARALEIVAQDIGGASLRTFERLFLDETGISLAAWRRQSRMLASLSLLAEGKSVNAVARAVGYESAAAFSAAFKQCFGVPPTSYETGRDGGEV
jgi:AraC-like DNA-binding protein